MGRLLPIVLLLALPAAAQDRAANRKRALEAFNRRQFAVAQPLFEELVAHPDPDLNLRYLDCFTLATIHLGTARWTEATELYRKALDAARERRDELQTCGAQAAIASTLTKTGAYEEARELANAALELAARLPESVSRSLYVSNAHAARGFVAQHFGDYEHAIVETRRAAELRDQTRPGSGGRMYLMAAAYAFQAGRSDEADRRAAEIGERARAAGQRETEADAWRYRALFSGVAQQRTRALECLRRAEELAPPGSLVAGDVHRERSRVRRDADPDAARRESRLAVEAYERGGWVEFQANTLLEAAELESVQGEPAEADRLARQAAEVHRPIAPRAARARAGILFMQGRYDEAEPAAREALEMLRGTESPRGMVEARMLLGSVQASRGRSDKAVATLREALADAERIRMSGRDSLHVSLSLALEAGSRFAEARDEARRAVELLEAGPSGREPPDPLPGAPEPLLAYERLAVNAHVAAPGDPAEAFHAAELLKARSLLTTLFPGGAPEPPPAAAGAAGAFRDALRARSALLEARAGGEALKQADARLAATREALAAAAPRYRELSRPEPPTLDVVRRELTPEGTVLVEFVWPMRGHRRGLVFVVTRERAQAAVFELHAGLEEAIDSWSRAAGSRDLDERALEAGGRRLYDLLVRPWATEARDARRLVLIPDGPLHFLPFEALPAPGGGVLGDRLTISYAPSATVLLTLRRPGPPAEAAPLAVVGSAEGLPAASEELSRIRSELAGPLRVLDRVSEARFRTEAALATSLVHLVAHGRIDERRPDRSCLELLAGDGEDGRLEARELFGGVSIPADLAVLSSCDSGRGPRHYGEGVRSLAWGFLHAGARSVVLSLWKVPDQGAARFMELFYRRLASGAPRDEALADARRDARAAGWPIHTWGAFVLVGEAVAPLPLERKPWPMRSPRFALSVGALLAGSLLLAGTARLRRPA
jgi:CHAT domain-containing protein